MARLYADENFHYPVVEELRHLGHDVLTALEAGRANQKIPDPDQLAFAVSQGRAVLTHNWRHFIRLHTRVSLHAGIIVCSDDANFPAQAQKIHEALQSCPILDNLLLRITKA